MKKNLCTKKKQNFNTIDTFVMYYLKCTVLKLKVDMKLTVKHLDRKRITEKQRHLHLLTSYYLHLYWRQ